MENMNKKTYQKPAVEIEDKTVNAVEAYSAAAVPAAAPAIGPVASGGVSIVAAVYSKNC